MKSFTQMIKTEDGICDTFVAYPDGAESYPGVIIYMDIFGVRPYLCQMAEQLAALGYYVLLPNLFYRVKAAPVFDLPFPLKKEEMPDAYSKVKSIYEEFKAQDAVRDSKELLKFLFNQEKVAAGHCAVVGYCMGGGIAFRVAAEYPEKIAALASFHAGRLATEQTDSPHLLAGNIQASVYLAHAENDSGMPIDQIKKLEEALDSAGVTYSSEIYHGAQHGFTMMDLPAGNEAAVKRHWEKLQTFLSQQLP